MVQVKAIKGVNNFLKNMTRVTVQYMNKIYIVQYMNSPIHDRKNVMEERSYEDRILSAEIHKVESLAKYVRKHEWRLHVS